MTTSGSSSRSTSGGTSGGTSGRLPVAPRRPTACSTGSASCWPRPRLRASRRRRRGADRKAAELMAKYGIDRALLAAAAPGDRQARTTGSWRSTIRGRRVQAHLLCGLAAALRCQCILLPARVGTARAHLRLRLRHRADRRALHLGADPDVARPGRGAGPGQGRQRAGLAAQLAARLRRGGDRPRCRAAEQRAERAATAAAGRRVIHAALVLADRSLVIRQNVARAYPVTRAARVTYTGSGYGAGYAQGKRADIGTGRVGQRHPRRSPGDRLAAACRRRAGWSAGLAAAQQRQEDRVGAVPVRPELRVPAIRRRSAGPAPRPGRPARPAPPRRRARPARPRRRPPVSARCGEQVT